MCFCTAKVFRAPADTLSGSVALWGVTWKLRSCVNLIWRVICPRQHGMGSLSLGGVISRYKWHSPSEKMLYLYHLAAFMKDIHTNMEERETERENVTLLATHRACWSACSEIPGSSTYPDFWTKECQSTRYQRLHPCHLTSNSFLGCDLKTSIQNEIQTNAMEHTWSVRSLEVYKG